MKKVIKVSDELYKKFKKLAEGIEKKRDYGFWGC